jgi:hypothetical protein
MSNNVKVIHLDASTFQKPLGDLAYTIALKVQREGPKLLPVPSYASADIYAMLRQSDHIYDLFCFLNADEKHVGWRPAYSVAVLPLIRSVIDCLFNITVILENPGVRAPEFRLSGFKQALHALDADQRRYGGDPQWDAFIADSRSMLDFLIRTSGLTILQVQNAALWPTLSSYLKFNSKTPPTSHQQFLRNLTYGFWQEYSAMAHATFQGLMTTAIFYMAEEVPYEQQQKFETMTQRVIYLSMSRVAAILLCTLTEVQAYFRFEGARINQRLHQVWKALIPVLEIKELYDKRYAKLMEDRGIGEDN